jgi:NADH dehydrogenase
MLKTDNVVSGNAKTFRDLGINPTALEIILPTYLSRFCSVDIKLVAKA